MPRPLQSFLLFARLVFNEALSGVALVAGAICVGAALLLGAFVDTSSFRPGIGDPLNLSLTACLFVGPVVAGGAATRCALLRRQQFFLFADSTARRSAGAMSVVFAALSGWGLLAYVGFCICILVGANRRGATTMSMVWLPAEAMMLIVLLASLGTIVGSLTSWILIGPSTAAGIYFVLSLLDLQAGSVGRFSPTYSDIFYTYGVQPNSQLLGAKVVLMAGLTAGVFAFAVYGRRVRLPLTMALVGARVLAVSGATAGVIGILAAPPGDVVLRHGGAGECASEHGVTLCYWPGPGVPVEASVGALAAARVAAAGIFTTPSDFYEPGLTPDSPNARPYKVPPPDDVSSAWPQALYAVVPAPCDKETARASDDLVGLILARHDPSRTDSTGPFREAIQIARGSVAEQRSWARSRMKALSGCR